MSIDINKDEVDIDINKHEVDINILFKQNENDLCSIKELYRKIDEIEEKIRQKNITDSALTDMLKKELESLKKLIQSENTQTNNS